MNTRLGEEGGPGRPKVSICLLCFVWSLSKTFKKVAQKRMSILSISGPFGALTINEMKKKKRKILSPHSTML